MREKWATTLINSDTGNKGCVVTAQTSHTPGLVCALNIILLTGWHHGFLEKKTGNIYAKFGIRK